ncbi:MAG: LysR substrate-binding domain-containing protein, partial [Planctomycetota bacterium]
MELPSVRQLECLIAVAETLHFRRAAEACYITQPALSAQIQQLENLVGVRLFERDRRRVLPTAAGAAMAEKAREVLSNLRDLTESAAAFKEPMSGTLKLGVIPTVAPYILPRALKEVRRLYPGLRLLLKEEQTDRLLQMNNEGALDVLLLALEADLGEVETLPLFRDKFLVAVSPGHRLGKRKRLNERDLADEDVLLLEDGHCLRNQTLSVCSSAGACELGDLRASSLGTLVQMVSGGV